MLCSRRVAQQWCFAVFLLCSPVPHYGRPIDGLTNRMKRSVTHAQLMHDKGRTLQDFKRRMWLQDLLDEVHTAEIRELPARPGVSSGAGVGLGLPGAVVGVSLGLGATGGTLHPHPKPPGGTKNIPISFHMEEEEGTNLPQETNKSQTYKDKDGARKAKEGKKKRGRSGKRREGERREGEKRKRRARSLGWAQDGEEPGSGYRLEWRGPFFGLKGALH
ncbi:parathyroid hormone-like hormone a [Coregonus clupeaformis]|uniref:parathyroid hormone-like hormone a n=1 Tax=Coregonus clupeaformis TaxID=59861 RepID=UPI001BE0DF4D|nr:parathyroid hormone-like hormone a [Coregonus clupeaformis]XP_041726689.1 parathyroid hormone-like hormone a [Coregonus clupeaformis]